MTPALDEIECFGSSTKTRPHFESARDLHRRGIWIGYLAHHDWSFENLPSFNDLIARYDQFMLPSLKPDSGTSGNLRHAICYGCSKHSEHSRLLKVLELPFNPKKKRVSKDERLKVSVLPLLDDNEHLLFCILKGEREHRNFKRYLFWKSEGEYCKSIALLGTTDSIQRQGTLDAIRAAYGTGLQQAKTTEGEVGGGSRPTKVPTKRPREEVSTPDSGSASKRRRARATDARNEIPQANGGSYHDQEVITPSTIRADARELDRIFASMDDGTDAVSPTPMGQTNANLAESRGMSRSQEVAGTKATSSKQNGKAPTKSPRRATRNSGVEPLLADPPQSFHHALSRLSRIGLPNGPATPSLSDGNHGTGSETREPLSELSDELSEAQARRVRLVWSFDADGRTGRIILCLANCPTAKSFLELLKREAERERSTKAQFSKAKIWWMDRTERDGKVRGVRITPMNKVETNEAAFRYLKQEIANSEHWEVGEGYLTINLTPAKA